MNQASPPAATAPAERVIVCSIPKSGTYLIGDLLAQLGYRDSGMHLGIEASQDYTDADPDLARSNPEVFNVDLPWPRPLERVGPGQFAVSHLSPDVAAQLRDFNIVFVYRNLRDVLCSFCRWTAKTGRWGSQEQAWRSLPNGPDKLLGFLEHHRERTVSSLAQPAKWFNRGIPCKVCFESLLGDDGPELQAIELERITRELKLDRTADELVAALTAAQDQTTLTKSAGRSSWESMWDERIEAIFEESGLKEINTELGYESTKIAELRRSFGQAEMHHRNCPICDRRDDKVICETDRHNLGVKTTLCLHCGAVYVGDCPSDEWISGFYRDHYWSLYNFGGIEHEAEESYRRTHQMLTGITKFYPEAPTSVLDIGCGTGGMLRAAREQFPKMDIFGVDPSVEAIERCREYGFNAEFVTDLTNLKLENDKKFDLITVVHVAEHMYDPVGLISSAAHYLGPDGKLFIDVPNIMSNLWLGTHFIHLAHLQSFHKTSLQNMLSRCGLRPVQWWDGLAEQWPWAIGVLAELDPEGPIAAADVPAVATPTRIENHVRRHVLPASPHSLQSRVNQKIGAIPVVGPALRSAWSRIRP